MSEANSAKGGKNQLIIAAVIVVIIVGGGSFYGGLKYAGMKKSANGFGPGNFVGRVQGTEAGAVGMRSRVGAGGGFVNGDILSLDDKSMTVKSKDGSSKIVFFSGTTEIGKFVIGAISDLLSGQSVMVTGKTNSDGSVTAQSIQIRPAAAPGLPDRQAGLPAGQAGTPTPPQQ